MDARIVSSDKARASWRDVIDTAVSGQDVVIERYGRPAVAVISYQDFVELQAALEELRDVREAKAALAEWAQNPESFEEWEEIKAELLSASADE